MDRLARALVRKLRLRVIKRRRKRALEDDLALRHQEDKGGRAAVALKTREMRELRRRLREMESRRWVCLRNGCGLRRFFSAGEWGGIFTPAVGRICQLVLPPTLVELVSYRCLLSTSFSSWCLSSVIILSNHNHNHNHTPHPPTAQTATTYT